MQTRSIKSKVVIMTIIAGSFYATCFQNTLWPFSFYPMYADAPTWRVFEIRTILADDSLEKLTHPMLLWPVGRSGFNWKIYKYQKNDKPSKVYQAILKYYFLRYNYFLNNELLPDLPPIKGLVILQTGPRNNTKYELDGNFPVEIARYEVP